MQAAFWRNLCFSKVYYVWDMLLIPLSVMQDCLVWFYQTSELSVCLQFSLDLHTIHSSLNSRISFKIEIHCKKPFFVITFSLKKLQRKPSLYYLFPWKSILVEEKVWFGSNNQGFCCAPFLISNHMIKAVLSLKHEPTGPWTAIFSGFGSGPFWCQFYGCNSGRVCGGSLDAAGVDVSRCGGQGGEPDA